MTPIRLVIASLILACRSTNAFVPHAKAIRYSVFKVSAVPFLPSIIESNGLIVADDGPLAMNPDADLIVGFVMIVAACTPYVLSLFFPDFFLKNFFLPIYKDDKDGREAEIAWKTRYATLGLVLTTLTAAEVLFAPNRIRDGVTVLRDSYIVWTIFYLDAILKIRKEAQEGIITENRFGIQLWHSIVVIVLSADVSQQPLAQAIIDSIKALFT